MLTMAPVPEPKQKHVPAWKKLGLKLKFAKEEPDDTRPRQNGTDNLKKRKAPAEEESVAEYTPTETSTTKSKKSQVRAEEAGNVLNGNGTSHEQPNEDEPRKKVKKSKSRFDESAEAGNGNKKTSKEPTNVKRPSKKAKELKVKTETSVNSKFGDTYEQVSSPPLALKTTPASKGKSVSFTPDTKTGDGDSVKGLYKTWIAKQIATDPSFDPSTVSPALRSIIPSTVASLDSPSPVTSTSPSNSDPTARDNQKPTKKKKTRLPKTSSGSDPSRFDPVLTYLTTHHASPESWKFSKPHQNQILKHLFSLRHIPPSYDSALLPYIRGLKGASARSRVRKAALAVREEDDKWLAFEPLESEKMENETAAQCNARRRRDYEAAVARIKQTLEEREDKREERDAELLGENEEWEQRCRKRRRAEIVLWGVGEEEEEEEEEEEKDEVVGSNTSFSPRQDTFGANDGRQMDSGMAQLARAAVRDPGPAPRVGRGVGMGMGGVETINAGGIAKGSQAKKIVFAAEDGAAQPVSTSNKVNGSNGINGLGRANEANGVHGIKRPSTVNGANGLKPRRNRKRRRRTGVPDDDDSSSSSESSSSSSSSDEEGQQQQQRQKKAAMQGRAEKSDSSSSGTSSSSSDDSDSDSD